MFKQALSRFLGTFFVSDTINGDPPGVTAPEM